ncbi:RNA polymerase sigma factor [Filimonas effusa]|uniref:Sigma-70 family RNA polymerase sigma factor n=1 Tax=Filimonas effusa TaxID=2508721 RepID=A0A4Q1D549_9BACT|nr:sigma-70 family RNA polymerase sigma factor [Filimonas effusa]RXK83610.1 sigma-70 family RNA polymerase sigma factor [Filimonas effusa]
MTAGVPHINESLISRIAEGDEIALRDLYQQYYQAMVFFAMKLIDNQAQAEDYVIVAFARYWERRSQFNSFHAVRSFLYKTVRNACLTWLEQQSVHARHHDAISKTTAEREVWADSRMMLSEMVQEIHCEIENLDEKYREVITLLFLQERSIQETADILQLTTDNVRKRKERAISMLRSRVVRGNLERLLLFYIIFEKMR